MATNAVADRTRLELAPVEPFDFAQSLAFVNSFIPCAGDHTCRTDTLITGGYADDVPFGAVVTETDDGRLTVDVEWHAAGGNPDAVRTWLARFLSLDDDLTPLYDAARHDPAFEPVVDDLWGYHHVRFRTPFEAACWAALSQRTPMSEARRLKRHLVEAAGAIAEVDGAETTLFPTPARVLDNEAAVRDVIAHDRKRKTVLSAAETFAADDLGERSDDGLRERLRDVWGFGDWSSEFIALRGFGRLTDVPSTERRFREAVASRYDLDAPEASDDDLARLASPYEPLVGYWAHYLRVWVHRHAVDE